MSSLVLIAIQLLVAITFAKEATPKEYRTIKLWDRQTGRCLKTLSGHKHLILGIAFHPKKQTLATCSQDQTIRLWDVQTGECKKVLRSPGTYENMNITGITSLNSPQKATLKTLGPLELASNYQSTSKVLEFPKLAPRYPTTYGKSGI